MSLRGSSIECHCQETQSNSSPGCLALPAVEGGGPGQELQWKKNQRKLWGKGPRASFQNEAWELYLCNLSCMRACTMSHSFLCISVSYRESSLKEWEKKALDQKAQVLSPKGLALLLTSSLTLGIFQLYYFTQF
jgi:hypothetical protein